MLLHSQELFETMLRPRAKGTQSDSNKTYAPWVGIAFGAPWCGPCRSIDKEALVVSTPEIRWYYCNVDVNNYTLGYCGLQSIPAFLLIKDGIPLQPFVGGARQEVLLKWIRSQQ